MRERGEEERVKIELGRERRGEWGKNLRFLVRVSNENGGEREREGGEGGKVSFGRKRMERERRKEKAPVQKLAFMV